ncbi:hypothetical protein KRX54_00180 [Actinomycetaceae bacterium TAE3-ERU4]|nr:hypothetical protein [Actinomycetaceae bacterium TAE3-ERU4]
MNPFKSSSDQQPEETFGQRIARERAESSQPQAPRTRYGKAAQARAQGAWTKEEKTLTENEENTREETPEKDVQSSPKKPEAKYDFAACARQWAQQVQEQVETKERYPQLHLTFAHPTGLAQLYGGKPVRLSNILREPLALAHGRTQLQAILDESVKQGRSLGLTGIQLAIGTVSADDLNTLPIMLRPLNIRAENGDYLITLQPGISTNSAFTKLMREHGKLDRSEEIETACWTRHGFAPAAGLEKLKEQMQGVDLPGLKIHEDIIIGLFENPLSPILEELEHVGELELSPLLRAIAGHRANRDKLLQPLPATDGTDADPDKEAGVGDLAPADQRILKAAQNGRSFLVEAGPGVEASPITAALLVENVKQKKSGVYATTDVPSAYALADTLKAHGLESWTVNLTDCQNWRQELREKLLFALEEALAPLPDSSPEIEEPVVDSALDSDDLGQIRQIRQELREIREQLMRYTNHLHRVHEPWNISAYEALQVLADLIGMRPAPRTKVRLARHVCRQIHRDGGQTARAALDDAVALGLFTTEKRTDPWAQAIISQPEQAEPLVTAVTRLARTQIPQIRKQVERISTETGLQTALTLQQWIEQLELLENVRHTLDVFLPVVFERSVADMIFATATPAWRREHGKVMKGSIRRRLVKAAKEMVRPGRTTEDLHEQLIEAQKQRALWTRHCAAGGWPRLPDDIDQMRGEIQTITADLDMVANAFKKQYPDIYALPLEELASFLESLADAPSGAYTQPALGEIRQRLEILGLAEFAQDMQERGVIPDMIVAELDLAWWASVLNQILTASDGFKAPEGPVLESLSARLRELDRKQVDSLSRKAVEAFTAARRQLVTINLVEAQKVRAELASDNGYEVLYLMEEHPWLWELLPFRIAPPLLAALLFPHSLDYVVLDRVETCATGLYVPLIARAKQLIAIGDGKFGNGRAWEQLCRALPIIRACASRVQSHQPIAALLSKYGFHTSAAPVPTPRNTARVDLVHVDGRGTPALGAMAVESTSAEVERVVDMVIDHAVTRPEQSLAVCASNERHGQHLREAILRAIVGSVSVDDFFRTDKAEPFVVVDPSRSLGIHRDRVIMSMGFGKTPHGRMLHDFGPISKPGGENVLASLLDVARDELTLVTAFKREELDETRLQSPGERLFLDLYALASGAQMQESAGWETVGYAPDRLLVDLAERLFRIGLEVVPNLGVEGGYRIPLAIGHPDVPGELLVAVLTDDERYVAEPSLRVRERHDVERLQASGWMVRRVYSTAVFVNPQAEADSLVELVLDAVDLRLGRDSDSSSSASLIAVPDNIEQWEEETLHGQVESHSDSESADDSSGEVDNESAIEETQSSSDDALREKATSSPEESNAESDLEVEEVETPVLISQSYVRERASRPAIAQGLPLAAYSDAQLTEMLLWVASDEVARTPEQYVSELHRALGLTRTGRQVKAVLGYIVRSAEEKISLLSSDDSEDGERNL